MPGAIGVLNFMGVYRSHSISSAKVMTAERKLDFDQAGIAELMTIHSAIPTL
jgi:hypothetical protein